MAKHIYIGSNKTLARKARDNTLDAGNLKQYNVTFSFSSSLLRRPLEKKYIIYLQQELYKNN